VIANDYSVDEASAAKLYELVNSRDAVARGPGCVASGQGAVAVGSQCLAIGDDALALGYAASARGNGAIAIGGTTNNVANSTKIAANVLNFDGLPTSAAGLASGDVYSNGGVLNLV
jgi:hypothetical protein